MYEFYDLSRLPVLGGSRRTLEVSSYDRRYLNHDWGNYLAPWGEDAAVIFDDPGCGCIKSIWMVETSPEATLEFYFAGELAPEYTTSLFGLFNGECAPLTGVGNSFQERGNYDEADCRCGNLFIQIPYDRGLRILLRGAERSRLYYHILYESYPEGSRPGEGSRRLMEQAHLPQSLPSLPLTEHTLAPGLHELAQLSGSGVLTDLTLRTREDADLTRVTVLIHWDGADRPQVACPLPDLFAQPVRWTGVESYPVTARLEDGEAVCTLRLPMPFFDGACIRVCNTGTEPVTFALGYRVEANPYPRETTGLFHADHRAGPALPGSDWEIAALPGHGRVVGLVQSCCGGYGGSYCEGNEHFYLNGEQTPSLNGTGTEDLYLGCYWPNKKYDSPCAGCGIDVFLLAGGDLVRSRDYPISYYRYFLDMPIAFDAGIRLAIQHGATNQNLTRYTTTCFSYRLDEPLCRLYDHIDLSSALSRQMHGYRTTGGAHTLTGALESDGTAPAMTRTGSRAQGGEVSFTAAIDPGSRRVILRRLYDQSAHNAPARVYVDGEYAGLWATANANPHYPFADTDFFLPLRLVSGKDRITLTLAFDGLYTDFEYWVMA